METEPSGEQASKGVRFEIKKWNAVTMWYVNRYRTNLYISSLFLRSRPYALLSPR